MGRTRQAGKGGRGRGKKQGKAGSHQAEHCTGLLHLPGALLALIWQQLELQERKAFYCTSCHLRQCPEINALLTDCLVVITPEGNSTPETDLQRWPRHAPSPKRLHVGFPVPAPEPGSARGLLRFLQHCMRQDRLSGLLRAVQEIRFAKAPRSPEHQDWQLSEEDTVNVTAVLGMLSPATTTLRLTHPVKDMATCLHTWQSLRTLEVAADPGLLTAVGRLNQLQRVVLAASGDMISLAPLAGLVALQSLSLDDMEVEGLPLIAQGCCNLTQLKLHAVWLWRQHPDEPLPPPHPVCTWPSLVDLCLDEVSPAVISTVLATPQAAPNLVHLVPPHNADVDHQYAWPHHLNWVQCSWHTMETDQLPLAVQCLAACSVPCQGFTLDMLEAAPLESEDEEGPQLDLSACLLPLQASLTHLQIMSYLDFHWLCAGWAKRLAETMPELRVVWLNIQFRTSPIEDEDEDEEEDDIPSQIAGVTDLIAHASSLRTLRLFMYNRRPSVQWLREVLFACAFVSATGHRESPLTVLLPDMEFEAVQAAAELWRDLCGVSARTASATDKVMGPVRVVVADDDGRDLLSLSF